MTEINSTNFLKKILSYLPVILLFISVLNESNFNYSGIKYFSFNFSYIIIFYYSLKKSNSLGYGLIFIAGLFNDVVIGIPLGISSLMYLLICGFAAYLKNITLRPSLTKDWMFFLMTILVVNSIFYMLLILLYSYEIDYFRLLTNIVFTFLLYFVFSYVFGLYDKLIFGKLHA
jgi:rod shape-determining protein MreD